MQLLWDLYRDDPYWIPPLRRNQEELVGFHRHPFYDNADGQAFLATRAGRPCGRIVAIVNHGHNQRYDEQIGFFGFFECERRESTAHALFEAAFAWLAERGIHRMRGAVNPSLNYELGLLIDGFDSSPFFMMTYNPPYYEEFIENYGFKKVQDLYAFWGHTEMIETLDKKLDFIIAEATRRFEIRLRPMDISNFDAEVNLFLNIYNQSLGGTWGFVPMSPGEIKHTGKSLKQLIVPEMTSVAEVDGRAVGACFGLLDYNPRIKAIDGRLFPLGFIRLLRNRRGIKSVRFISTNVLPEYQRWGVGLVVLSRLGPAALEWGIEDVEFSWVLESNHLSYKTLKRGGAKVSKTYRVYDGEKTGGR